MRDGDDKANDRPHDAGVDDRIVAEQVSRPPAAVPGGGAIRETTYKQPAGREQVPATEAIQAELSAVNATTVLMERSGAEQITAERVSMDRSGAKAIDTRSAQLDRSGVVALGSEHTVLLNSAAVQVVAEEARLSRSRAVFVSAEKASIEDSRILVFAGSADGDVNPLLTARGAAIAGAAFGFAVVLLGALMRSKTRRT